MSQTLIAKLHARLDLERAIVGGHRISADEYTSRTVKMYVAASKVKDIKHHCDLSLMASTRLVDAMSIDVAKNATRPTVSVVTNYMESIRDDPSKMAAWFWMCFIDDVLHQPYDECTGVYADALYHLQPVGIMALIHAFDKLTYHVNVHEQRRIVDEVVFANRVLRM